MSCVIKGTIWKKWIINKWITTFYLKLCWVYGACFFLKSHRVIPNIGDGYSERIRLKIWYFSKFTICKIIPCDASTIERLLNVIIQIRLQLHRFCPLYSTLHEKWTMQLRIRNVVQTNSLKECGRRKHQTPFIPSPISCVLPFHPTFIYEPNFWTEMTRA